MRRIAHINAALTVIRGTHDSRLRSQLEAAYAHFRLDRQGNLVTPGTLEYYDYMLGPFLAWLRDTTPGAVSFEQVDVGVMRLYRAYLAERPSRNGGRLQPATILDSHRALSTLFRWARSEGYPVDARILELKRPRVPDKEPDVFHIAQLRQILAACTRRSHRRNWRSESWSGRESAAPSSAASPPRAPTGFRT